MISSSTTTSSSQREEILARTFSGAKWMLYLSASALVAGFFTNVILGRMGVEVLGFYSLLMLIVSMVQTFFVFGASNVFVNYLPTLSTGQRPKFVLTYTLIVYAVGMSFLAICLLFPSVLQLVFRSELGISTGMYLAVLVPILLAQVLIWAILQSEMEVTVLAFSQNAVSWFYLVNIGLMAGLGFVGATSGAGSYDYIFTAVVLSNLLALAIAVRYLRKENIKVHGVSHSWFLPAGFWKFTLSVYVGTLFNFIILNAAPVFILRELGLRELGYFRAAAVFAAFVAWVPSVFDKSFYPSFCNLVSKKLPTDEAYTRFSRLNAMSSGFVALVIILFTRELLGLFGKEFSDGAYFLLIMLSAGYVVSTPFIMVNFALVTAHLKTPYTMAAYAFGAACGVALFSTLVPRFGLEGIALSFIALQVILFASSWVLTKYFTHSPFPGRAYLIVLCVVCVGFIGAYYFGSVSFTNALTKLGLVVLLCAGFVAARIVTKSEIKEVLAVVVPRKPWAG